MRISLLSVLVSISLCLIVSCKQDASSGVVSNGLTALESTYKSNPTAGTGSELIKGIMENLKEPNLSDSKKNELLEYGLKVSKEQNLPTRAAAFLFPLVKNNATAPNTADRIFDLAAYMKSMKKETASNTLYKGLLDNFPGFSRIGEVKQHMTVPIDSIDVYIKSLGGKLFEDVDNTGINKTAALQYVDACEAYALAYPQSPQTPETLFKAAEVAKSLRTFSKSLSLYDWILEKYPNYDKAPTSLFLKGFIIENNIGDDTKARELYDAFLVRYPKHDLADDVQFLIDNLGKTDEQILDMIESKRAENEAKK